MPWKAASDDWRVSASHSLREIDAADWDALGRQDYPFTRHAFLLDCITELAELSRQEVPNASFALALAEIFRNGQTENRELAQTLERLV